MNDAARSDPDPLQTLLLFHKSIRAALQVLDTTAAVAGAGMFDVIKSSALYEFFRGPLRWHDEDEGLSLFPRILALAPERALPPLRACAREHERMEAAIDNALDHLRGLADGLVTPDAELLRATSLELHAMLVPHLRREEAEIFPLARSLLDERARRDIGLEMHARRLRRLANAPALTTSA